MLSESEKVKKAYIILTQTQKTCHEHLHAATVVLSKVVAFPSNNSGIENFCYFDFRTFHQLPTFQHLGSFRSISLNMQKHGKQGLNLEL